MPKNIYVVRHGNDWAVRSENSKRPARVVSTQREAIDIATPMAKRNEAELRLQDVHGKFRTCNSYGNDPCPPKDKNR